MSSQIFRLTGLFLTLFCSAYAQNTSPDYLSTIVDRYIQHLRTEGVDTICVYEDYFVGSERTVKDTQDRCPAIVYIPVYVVWVKEGKTYLSKKDNCFDYSIAPIDADSLWSHFFHYEKAIRPEIIKPFQYIYYQKGRKKTGLLYVAHSRLQDFTVYYKQDSIRKRFDSFDLQTDEDFDEKKRVNINSQHNQNLRSKKFIDYLDALVRKSEVDSLLIKNRR